MSKLRVVHYLNQFFAGVGGEEKANLPPKGEPGALGPGKAIAAALAKDGDVVGTVYCGDNYIGEKPEVATEGVLELIKGFRPDVVIAGPAFMAGRYGIACAQICADVQEKLGIPAVTGMHRENPAVNMFRSKVYIASTRDTAAGMADATSTMARLALKLASKQPIGLPAEEGYIPRGLRYSLLTDKRGAARAVEMLVKRLRGEPFETERPIPVYDKVPPASPIHQLNKATIALVTTGGLVPKGNPDRMEATFATKWLKYNVRELPSLSPGAWQSVHGGYDTTSVNRDPHRVVPLDVMRELEDQGVIGQLHDYIYTTVGSGASLPASEKFAREIADDLTSNNVQGVILTAT